MGSLLTCRYKQAAEFPVIRNMGPGLPWDAGPDPEAGILLQPANTRPCNTGVENTT